MIRKCSRGGKTTGLWMLKREEKIWTDVIF